MQPEDLHPHVTDVVNQDIMPQLVSTMNQFATNVEKWPIHRKSAGEADLQGNHRKTSIMYRMMQQMSIISPGKATPWNILVDIRRGNYRLNGITHRSLKVSDV